MRRRRKLLVLGSVILVILIVAGWYLHRTNIPLLEPRGPIAEKERNLMLFAAALSLVVVLPVFSIAIYIAWKYREGNTGAKYSPEFDHSRLFESIWWLIPTVLIGILSVVAWNSSHTLDPYRPLASSVQPITVDVVALDWKWLFIYPQQEVASVNQLEIPVNTPIDFNITSDAPMNSFWIPQLSGQIYAMPGMSTQLHLSASKAGIYNGYSANISGVGFAGMTFKTNAVSTTQFNYWTYNANWTPKHLTMAAYNQLAKPSENNPVSYYSSVDRNLYTNVIDKYMEPADVSPGSSTSGLGAKSNTGGQMMYNMSGMSM
jgi:cytochrome o ubiquinol oxidase subunit 2